MRNVENTRDLADTLKWVKFSGISWTKDSKGFFYSGYEPQTSGNKLTNVNRNQRVYYHKVGTKQSADYLIYDRKDQPDWLFSANVTDDGTFAIITVFQGTDARNRLFYIFLDNPKKPSITAPIVRLIDNNESENEFVDNLGDYFLVRTDRGAPKGQIVQIDINNAEPRRWVSVVPEGRDALTAAHVAGKHLVLTYLQDAHSSLRIYGLPILNDPRRNRGTSGPGGMLPGPSRNDRAPAPSDDRRRLSAPGYPFINEIELPGIGSVDQISAREDDDEMFYSYTSFVSPTAIYRYDVKRRTNTLYKSATLPIDATQFETKQVFYNSKDGTRVPMFITMKKGTVLNGANPTILYGYGGFNIAETPAFSPANLVWMEMGGIYAVANIRGGSEYGKDWHEAGMLGKKAERVRRLHRGGRVSDQGEVHVDAEACDFRRIERRTSRWCRDDAASGAVRRRAPGSRRDGHAALPEVHDRLGVDVGLRLVRRSAAVPVPARVFAAAQHQAGNEISANACNDCRSRRSSRARAFSSSSRRHFRQRRLVLHLF